MRNSIGLISNILDPFFKEEDISQLKEEKEKMFIDFVSDNQRFLSFSLDKELSREDFPKGLFPFFNRGEPKLCSFCDYLVFTEYKGRLFILLIELKKGKENVTKQLNAAQCFVEYLIATVNRVYNVKLSPQIRQISIRARHIKPRQRQKEIRYEDDFHTFQDSKFWLKKYLV
ncbi:hypothetical protein [Sphingobacterium spiritivorum]|uniref:hypothetical protein n=1 Tax=Sphingobacterium spiritivorum TaxID=258 RepID=UPI003DA64B69